MCEFQDKNKKNIFQQLYEIWMSVYTTISSNSPRFMSSKLSIMRTFMKIPHFFSKYKFKKRNYLLVGTKDIGTEFIYLLFCRNQINIFLIHSDPMQNYLSKMIVRLIVDWIKKIQKKKYILI